MNLTVFFKINNIIPYPSWKVDRGVYEISYIFLETYTYHVDYFVFTGVDTPWYLWSFTGLRRTFKGVLYSQINRKVTKRVQVSFFKE